MRNKQRHIAGGSVQPCVFAVPAIPRTLSGKILERQIKKLLLGQVLDEVVNPDTMAIPDSLGWYAKFARRHLAMAAR